MSNEVKFVFSTRFVGEGYAFGKLENFQYVSSDGVLEYLKKRFWSEKNDLWESFKKYRLSAEAEQVFKDRFQIDIANFSYSTYEEENEAKQLFLDAVDNEKLVSLFIEKEIISSRHSWDFNENNVEEKDKFSARFKFFRIKDTNNNSIENVYAVLHLGRGNQEWVKALIHEKFNKVSNDEKELYLVLHDNDVPRFASTPYRYLTAREIYRLLKGKEYDPKDDPQDEKDPNTPRVRETTDGDEVYYLEDGRKLTIIVFQHTWNDVVYLLKKSDTTCKEIQGRLMTGNKKKIRDFFKLDLDPVGPKHDFLGLNPDYSVDVCQNKLIVEGETIKDKKLVFSGELNLPMHKDNESEYKKIRIYTDKNGALLTALMHVGTNSNSAEMLKDFIRLLRKPGHLDDEANEKETNESVTVDLKKISFPLIIRIYKSFFKDWEDAVTSEGDKEKIRNHHNKKALEENLERVFSFFNNSSIWVRLVDMYDQKAYNRAVDEFEYFDSIGLYDYNSAWENLEYNLRIFSENYLESTLDGHGNFVTPMVYGDETEALEILADEEENKRPLNDNADNQ